MIEIERKFLVKHTRFLAKVEGVQIKQGYLTLDPKRSVRVRTKGEQGYITIKGASSADGSSRYEWEKPIPKNEAEELLQLALLSLVHKTRYGKEIDGVLWEIDVFHGLNSGLVIAEVELEHAEQQIELPNWIAREVTQEDRYFNLQLAQNPYTQWKDR